MAAPFLKWAGGKRALAPAIVARAPRVFARYHEPFLGAGAVFFTLEGLQPGLAACLGDANEDLSASFAALRDEPEAVIAELEALAAGYLARDTTGRAAFFYGVRAARPLLGASRAAWLIFLNRTCYNGLYRVNAAGAFNVPHGRYRQPRIYDPAALRAASVSLRRASIAAADFEDACAVARPGDFVYLDPPYQPLSRTASFTAYTSASFGAPEQARLAAAFDDLTRRGVAALLSNSHHPDICALYGGRGYTIEAVEMPRAINSVGSGRAPVAELLIGNLARPEVRAALLA